MSRSYGSQSRLQNGLVLGLILATALFLRWRGLNWDQHHHYHPDERYISWVATSIEFGENSSFADALTPNRSTINPFYWPAEKYTEGVIVPIDEQRKFAYGHLPLYLGVGATRLIEQLGLTARPLLERLNLNETGLYLDFFNGADRSEFDHITIVGRWLTGLFDTGTVLLLFLLGRRLYGPLVGLTAAAFLAVNVMHIQLGHFFTSDPYMTFFVVLTIYFLSWIDFDRKGLFPDHKPLLTTGMVFAGIATGMAVGSKFSAVLLVLPLVLALFLYQRAGFFKRLFAVGFISLLSLIITNPFVILDYTCVLSFELGQFSREVIFPGSCYLENITDQNAMVNGSDRFPFTRQYAGTFPYLYYIENQLNWGMGVLLGLAAFIGFAAWTVYGIVINRNIFTDRNRSSDKIYFLILMAWCLPFFLTTGSFYVKFMRYLQPLTPFLMLFAAWAIWQIRPWWLRNTTLGMTTVFTLGYALAFSQIYSEQHPWHVASAWAAETADEGASFANELWDEPLPTNLGTSPDPVLEKGFEEQTVNWLSGQWDRDNEEKLERNLTIIADSEYVIVASNRSYGVVSKLPSRYPISSQYFRLLFDGALGFELVYVGDRSPKLAGFSFGPETFASVGLTRPEAVDAYFDSRNRTVLPRADESFTVYDQPLVLIFRNRDQLSVEELKAQFDIE